MANQSYDTREQDLPNIKVFYESEELPTAPKELMETFSENEDPFEECFRLQDEMNKIGWGFEFYLDAVPCNFYQLPNK